MRLGPALQRPAAGHRRLGRRDRLAARTSGSRPSDARRPRCRRRAGVRASCRAAARWRPTRRCGAFCAAGGRAGDRSDRARGGRRCGRRRRWRGPAPLRPKGRCWSIAPREPAAVQAVQGRLGVERAGELVERALAAIARGLVERGVRRLVVAGGETSGACVQALGVAQTAHRPADRPRRAVVPRAAPARRRVAASGVEVGQLRQPTISSPKRSTLLKQ